MLAALVAALVMLTAQHAASDALDARIRRLAPHNDSPAQKDALRSTAPQLAFMGRRHGGKSWVTCAKAAKIADHYGPNHRRRYPSAQCLLAREERASMTTTVVRTMRVEILGEELFAALYRAGDDSLYFPNGSSIAFRGLDQPKRILGMRYMFIGIDQAEQIDEEQAETAISGTMQAGMPWGQFFCAFNPDNPEHWAYLRYHPDDGDGPRYDSKGRHFADVVHVQENDLMGILSEEQRDVFDRLSGIWRERLRYGRWVAFTGIVHDLWDPGIHVISNVPNAGGYRVPESWAEWGGYPPPDWRRWRGIDFGYNPDPYSVGWLTLSPDGVWYVYRQEYRLKLTLDRQVDRILRYEHQEKARVKAAAKRFDILEREAGRVSNRWDECRDVVEGGMIFAGVSDHGADQRAFYAKRGIKSWPANKDIWAGLETVRNLMDPAQEGGPRLFVVSNEAGPGLGLTQRDKLLEEAARPTCLQEEMGRYLWGVSKTAAGAKVMKDLPVDANNHGNDWLRYVLHTFTSRRATLVDRTPPGRKRMDEDESLS